jgi:diacylglycerol kinase family enzyme
MISIIINPVSGGGTPAAAIERAQRATRHLQAHGEPGDVQVTTHRGHAHALASAAVRRGDARVVAWGGDGTVNEIASALVGTDSVLGIVPAGSGNGLARELRLPTAPDAALDAALSSASRSIDAGTLGERWFFSIAGIGFDAHVAAAFDRAKGGRGLAGYVRVIARELWRYECESYRLDGADARRALLLTFANTTQFGNGAVIAPAAVVDDGLLDFVLFEERSRVATLCGLPRLFTASVDRASGVSIRKVTSVTVENTAPMLFHVDGEPVQGGTRLVAQIHRRVLKVASGHADRIVDLTG